ncbi:MAG: RNA-protein complex protein Nop10 [Candidatus Nanoarchaeia archaeon]|nr:RNA-protein complex protein Nop10 [Candidatus Nanoarchaeia archaeon]
MPKVEILNCESCNVYTLKKICPKCGRETISNKPGKFSVEDRYGKYRRLAKKVYKG